jgi:hypothetical protein
MPGLDWRSPEAYRNTQTIPPAGFAWEYLRRDGDYRRDFEVLKREGRADAGTLATFSDRWGVRFRH